MHIIMNSEIFALNFSCVRWKIWKLVRLENEDAKEKWLYEKLNRYLLLKLMLKACLIVICHIYPWGVQKMEHVWEKVSGVKKCVWICKFTFSPFIIWSIYIPNNITFSTRPYVRHILCMISNLKYFWAVICIWNFN